MLPKIAKLKCSFKEWPYPSVIPLIKKNLMTKQDSIDLNLKNCYKPSKREGRPRAIFRAENPYP